MDNVRIMHILSLVEAYGCKNYRAGGYHCKGDLEREAVQMADGEHVYKQIKDILKEEK
jgi:hypothetical protein